MTESQITKKTATEKKQIIQRQYKFFISNVNTIVGQALVESLRNDHENDENPHLILGSLSKQEQNEVPRGVYKAIDPEKVSQFTKVILECDIIIYDLSTCDIEEAEFVMKVLKMAQFKDEKIFILISNVMTWSNTQLKIKEKKDNEPDDEGLEDLRSDDDMGGIDDDENQKKVILKYTEKEYTLRRPLPQYEGLKQLENMCLQAGASKPNLKTYVLCSGIQYGNGENVFYNLFKQAWVSQKPELEIIGQGKNRIPTIHVKDLANFVKKIIEKTPQQQYIFAVDHSIKNSQASIVQAISKAIGTGQTTNIDFSTAAQQNDLFHIFTLDLRLKQSKVFESSDSINDGGLEENYTAGVEDRASKNDFEWHCKEGMIANIAKLNKEFNEFRGLRSNKIFIYGPPASGKTTLGQKISQKYGIAHIHMQQVIDQVKALDSQIGDEVRKYLEEEREKLVEKAQMEFEMEKKKRKPKKGEPEPEFDSSKIQARLNDEYLFKVFKWRLNQADCQNKGFVLDGFPKNYKQAQGLFLRENAEEGTSLEDNIIPESIIFIDGSEDFIRQRVKEMPEEKITNSHYTDEGMNRRYALYKQYNDSAQGLLLADFFKNNNIDLLKLDIQSENLHEQIYNFIDRNGKYDTNDEEENEESNEQKQDNQNQNVNNVQQEDQKTKEERELKKQQEEEQRIKLEKIKNQEREKLDERSYTLRQYLADNIVPFLTESLIQLCKMQTEDPVDQLVELLLAKSQEESYIENLFQIQIN